MRSYQKISREKDLFEAQKPTDKTITPSPVLMNIEKKYQKGDGYKEPQWFCVLISGGEKREKDYFLPLLNADKFNRIKIEFIPDPTNPDGLLKTAKNRKAYYSTSETQTPDKYFIISDIDHFYNDLVRVKPVCKTENFSLIISNPCFEIWLYYGVIAIPPTDFQLPDDPLKISQAFKNYLNEKVTGGVNPKKAIFKLATAIANAQKHYTEDEKGIPTIFSTNMFLLGNVLLPLISSELTELIAQEEQKKAFYTQSAT